MEVQIRDKLSIDEIDIENETKKLEENEISGGIKNGVWKSNELWTKL
ncbi:MAG: hypothetical protein Q4A15_12765 [Prevotellaceae bacterium]|nr:hypothetical protein [Prevotellaceae bacterium]